MTWMMRGSRVLARRSIPSKSAIFSGGVNESKGLKALYKAGLECVDAESGARTLTLPPLGPITRVACAAFNNASELITSE